MKEKMPMMDRIYKCSFEMAHTIKDHPKCGYVHGHSYNLTININWPEHVWIDFSTIKTNIDNYINSNYSRLQI